MARPRFEHVAKSQRRKRRVAAGAAARDGQSIGVDVAAQDEMKRAMHAIVDVHDTPVTAQPFAVLPPIAGASAVVDVENGESAAGPILDTKGEYVAGRRRGTAMHLHDEGRLFSGKRRKSAIFWPVEKRVRHTPPSGRVFDGLGDRNVVGIETKL